MYLNRRGQGPFNSVMSQVQVPPSRAVSDQLGPDPGADARPPAALAATGAERHHPVQSADGGQVDAVVEQQLAYTWAGDLSADLLAVEQGQQRGLLVFPQRRSVLCRAPGGALPAAGTRLRWRCSVAREFPSNSHALFTEVSDSSRLYGHVDVPRRSAPSPRSRESSSKSACTPPTTSSAALVRANSGTTEFLVLPAAAARSPPPRCPFRPPGLVDCQAILRAPLPSSRQPSI